MRLVTRADFDGIACGVLITAQEDIDRFLFVEPKFMQDGEVEIDSGDIIANLPYHQDCHLWFDHHFTNQMATPFRGNFRIAPSAARVVFEYYSQDSLSKYETLVTETDRIDSGNLEMEDILNPRDYVLLSFTIDPSIKEDESFWIALIHLLRDQPFSSVMEDPDVKKRCRRVLDDFKVYQTLLASNSRQEANVAITDLRNIDFKGKVNRFLVYTLFPDANVSVKLFNDKQREGWTGISVGKNIFNKTSPINVGELLTHHGGGGHQGAGSCRVPDERFDKELSEIISELKDAPTDNR
jgi:hypothetical protein